MNSKDLLRKAKGKTHSLKKTHIYNRHIYLYIIHIFHTFYEYINHIRNIFSLSRRSIMTGKPLWGLRVWFWHSRSVRYHGSSSICHIWFKEFLQPLCRRWWNPYWGGCYWTSRLLYTARRAFDPTFAYCQQPFVLFRKLFSLVSFGKHVLHCVF